MEKEIIIEEMEGLYRERFGEEAEIVRLPGAGSDRQYFRLTDKSGLSVIGTYGADKREDKCFIGLARVFREAGVRVPEIYAENLEEGIYLQEELGERDLLSYLKNDREAGVTFAKEALRQLAKMQRVPEEEWGKIVMSKPFSRRMVMWDLNYFKYEFLKPAGILFDEERLEDDFERMSENMCDLQEKEIGFMYRDFQSRNVMIKEGIPFFIDFQGGRKGPMVYDAVSFLWQAKAGFSHEEREELLNHYLRELNGGEHLAETRATVRRMVLLRTLQVLGAYGFRGLVEKKSHFIESIPAALENLREILERGDLGDYPELERAARQCVESRFSRSEDKEDKGRLTVKVFSFSYKKGYPEDLSGNGGGFMFDCRGMYNPGRYDEYKPLTGLDRPVKEFLEAKGEVQEFIRRAVEIASPTIERYASRGFTSLQVGFGCTGGRHRSVYCAQGFAEEIARRFKDVRVVLTHREQGIRELRVES